MRKIILVLLTSFHFGLSWSQTIDSAWKFSGYAEVYYSYDFARPTTHEKSSFLYNHKRHDEINVNLALAKAQYQKKGVRANLALMTGNYAQYNLSGEATLFQSVFEANLGIALSEQNKIWLDVGIMPSHIGFESAISADCWTSSRSLLAENSPYYETGVKITKSNQQENLSISALWLNGWQKIQKPTGITQPSFGMQITYKPVSNLTLNYSNFLGSDRPDSINAFRTYHNFYAIWEIDSLWGLIAGFDIGTDRVNPQHSYKTWYSPVLILRRILNERTKIAIRGEYFQDKFHLMIPTLTANGFQVKGISVNVDRNIYENALLRFEVKSFLSKDNLFKEYSKSQNFSLLATLSVKI